MYWLVSLPLLETADRTWNLLQNKTTYETDLSINYRFEIPELRVGTLDSLMVLSDDLVKVNALVESVVNKIRRQLYEMQGPEGEREDVVVEGLAPDNYLEKFSWNEAKYPPRRPLNETVSAITETIQKLEDDLKVRMSEYNQLKGQISALNRKQMGSLAVRDLGSLIHAQDFVDTENLVSLYVVVPRSLQKDFLNSYETLSEFVVPRSAKVVVQDHDYILFSVILFKRVADSFKNTARAKGFQVRDYHPEVEGGKDAGQAGAEVQAEMDTKRQQLEQWCSTAYGEAFSAWIHVCAIRLFAESILRYGLPPQFLAALLKPNAKTSGKLRKILAQLFSISGQSQYFEADSGTTAGLPLTDSEMFPYVSFTISIDG